MDKIKDDRIISVNLNFLFHLIATEKDETMKSEALKMALFTLEMMSQGGIHDHVSKGFARYSTDPVKSLNADACALPTIQ